MQKPATHRGSFPFARRSNLASGGTGGPSCQNGLTDCDGACVDLMANVEHRGTCPVACASEQSCNQGSCEALPKTCLCPVEAYCDLATNSCKSGCLADTDCSGGRYCDTAARQCKAGCRGDGDCGANETCNLGPHTCDCVGGTHRCSGACVSNNSIDHCGSQCSPCPGSPNGTATCNGQSCSVTCSSGYHDCGGSCSSNTSPASCGSSCTPCPTVPNGDAVCSGGACQIQCHAGAHWDGGSCVLDESCAGQTCSGHGQCSVQGGTAICTCDTGYQAQGMTCVPKSCQQDSNCPIEFYCNAGACQPGCHGDKTRCPVGEACTPAGGGWSCSSSCNQPNTNYPWYECNGADWACVGNSRCRQLCTSDADCNPGDKCATFAINYYGWYDQQACVKNCNTNPSECGEAYDNYNGPCSCAADGICRDPTQDECRLPNYSAF